ncbi:hypothetical protein TWF506_007520 [Arthrobotrys conoides]|uniref:Carboxylesterase type B domain-containing protein n=1 Tax=Arthrobotrys conoides TaxID=74498 RepID=A0AAN8RY44_9PEZI
MHLIKYLKLSSFLGIFLISGALCTLPDLKLKWGTYSPTAIQNLTDVKVYRDVRFGLPPTGPRRFTAAQSPDENFDTSHDHPANCLAVSLSLLKKPECNASPGFALELARDEDDQSEDCLFLDIYVPSNLTSYTAPLPVIVWFYGGAYIYGAKYYKNTQGLLYGGVGAIRSAALHGNGVIFVTGNYRLGALGWLAGSYMEAHGTPNAGLTDQRLLLEFVQNYIQQLNGDPGNVSAWGESAGGGSIMHHLVARNDDGTLRDPLFRKAIVQSPAYEWRWDRSGKLNDQYLKFATQVGYPDGNLTALQNAPIDKIMAVNNAMVCSDHKNGLFPFGPAIDGKLITDIPVHALGKRGHYWDKLDSVISSHVATEAASFTKGLTIKDKADFTRLVGLSFPGSILEHIERSSIYFKGSPTDRVCLWDWHTCYTQIVQDSMFMANVRAMYEAYKNRCYMLNYRWPWDKVAKHGTDLLLTFDYAEINLAEVIKNLDPGTWGELISLVVDTFKGKIGIAAGIFQQYFASHAVSSNPGKYRSPDVADWPIPKDGDILEEGVMMVKVPLVAGIPNLLSKPQKYFTINGHPDLETTYTRYDFWWNILDRIINPKNSDKNEADELQERTEFRDEL